MRKVKAYIPQSDPRHPNYPEFLRLTREGPINRNGTLYLKEKNRKPSAGNKNIIACNRPKYSYVLSEHIYRI